MILDDDGTRIYPGRGIATILNVGRNTMYKKLREAGILNEDNLPIQNDRRLWRIKSRELHNGQTAQTLYATDEGLLYLNKLAVDLNIPKAKTKVDEVPDLVFEI